MTIELDPFAARQYENLAPWTDRDEINGYPLAFRCQARSDALRDVLFFTELDENGREGARDIVYPEKCPDPMLPWLSNLAGEKLLPGTPADERRQLLLAGGAGDRDTVASIARAVLATLVSTDPGRDARVRVTTRYQDELFRILVQTYTAETPDVDAAEAAAKRAAPGGWRVIFETLDGWTIGDMETAYSGDAIGVLEADFDDIADLERQAP